MKSTGCPVYDGSPWFWSEGFRGTLTTVMIKVLYKSRINQHVKI